MRRVYILNMKFLNLVLILFCVFCARLWLLFSQFDSWEPIAGIVMRNLVMIAASTGKGPLLNIDLEQVLLIIVYVYDDIMFGYS